MPVRALEMQADMRVLVAGRSGQLARALAIAALPDPSWRVETFGRPDLDLSDTGNLDKLIAGFAPDIVVNAAAYTAVDKAESEPELAFAVNATGAGNLAQATASAGIPIMHVSTDYVFPGDSEKPYVENDPTGPINVYGQSKLAGEAAVAAANPHHVILRTSWVYSPWGNNFLRKMLELGAEREELRIVGDQTGTPTYAGDLASAILAIAGRLRDESSRSNYWGIYHLTNSGTTTWFDFADEIFRNAAKFGYSPPKITNIATSEYPTPARRPLYSVLDNGKVAEIFDLRLRDWREATADCVAQLLNEAG